MEIQGGKEKEERFWLILHPAKRKASFGISWNVPNANTFSMIGFGTQSWASSTAESVLLKENYW